MLYTSIKVDILTDDSDNGNGYLNITNHIYTYICIDLIVVNQILFSILFHSILFYSTSKAHKVLFRGSIF